MEAGEPIGPVGVGEGSGEGDRRQDKGIIWTVAYYAILVAGAVGFYYQLFPLTESVHGLPVVLKEE